MTRPHPPRPLLWVRAGDLAPYLEHDGHINDGEYPDPGGHLDAIAASNATLDEARPVTFNIHSWDDGTRTGSVADGNHRLLLLLAEPDGPDQQVPVHIVHGQSTHPGAAYHGQFDQPGE